MQTSPWYSYFTALGRYQFIVRQFLLRDVTARYRGSALGVAWALLTPLLLLATYTFVFVGVFKARWPGAEQGGGVVFALRLFCGLLVYQYFADVVSRAPFLITRQPELVKKIRFPLEVLPYVAVGSAFVHFVAAFCLLLVATFAVHGSVHGATVLMPLILLPLTVLLVGLGWLFAALGVYLRDLGAMISQVVNLLLFLSPVFYPLESLPSRVQVWIRLNPLTAPIEDLRRAVFDGASPSWEQWLANLAAATAIAFFGALTFGRLRKGFADVL